METSYHQRKSSWPRDPWSQSRRNSSLVANSASICFHKTAQRSWKLFKACASNVWNFTQFDGANNQPDTVLNLEKVAPDFSNSLQFGLSDQKAKAQRSAVYNRRRRFCKKSADQNVATKFLLLNNPSPESWFQGRLKVQNPFAQPHVGQ